MGLLRRRVRGKVPGDSYSLCPTHVTLLLKTGKEEERDL